jgi:hypothetical protein
MTDTNQVTTQTSYAETDPLAIFAATEAETKGVTVTVEDPRTGDPLIKWSIARFGGVNNTAIVREERKLKGKLPQGVRRSLDAGGGDPEIAQRLNRQVFVRVSCLGWEMVHPALKKKYGIFTHEAADEIFEAYPRMYDQVAELAMDEQTFAEDALKDTVGN